MPPILVDASCWCRYHWRPLDVPLNIVGEIAFVKLNATSQGASQPLCYLRVKGIKEYGCWTFLHPFSHSRLQSIANCSQPGVGWFIPEEIGCAQESGHGPLIRLEEVRYCGEVELDSHRSHAQARTVMHLNRLRSASAWTSLSCWVAGQICQWRKKQRRF